MTAKGVCVVVWVKQGTRENQIREMVTKENGQENSWREECVRKYRGVGGVHNGSGLCDDRQVRVWFVKVWMENKVLRRFFSPLGIK